MTTQFKIGDRVKWRDSVLRISKWPYRRIWRTERGTVYRIDKTRLAVMPDDWAKEGHKDGMLLAPERVTRLPAP